MNISIRDSDAGAEKAAAVRDGLPADAGQIRLCDAILPRYTTLPEV